MLKAIRGLPTWHCIKSLKYNTLEFDFDFPYSKVQVYVNSIISLLQFPKGSQVPSLTLGEAFVSGSDDKHFCKPTDVAVSSSGIFFVSDGYCNKRILKFDADGRLLDVFTGPFNIVHSLTLMEEKDALCVADRENSRIVCIHAGLKEGPGQAKFGSPYGPAGYKGKHVGRVFAVAAKGTEISPATYCNPVPSLCGIRV